MKEYFGWDGYQRSAAGFMSWQHILIVTIGVLIMTGLAIFFGIKNKGKDDKAKNKVLIIAAILIDALEIFKIILICFRAHDAMGWIRDLPLFMCSIQLITIPVAAFSKGRVREAALDFVFIFGLVGALAGTYGAGNLYGSYPAMCFDNNISLITHCISGFCSIYIGITGLATMKNKNIPFTLAIITVFGILALIANKVIDYNYMFLRRGDGTPYEVLFSLVKGNKILYPIGVMLLFYLLIVAFYVVHHLIVKKKENK